MFPVLLIWGVFRLALGFISCRGRFALGCVTVVFRFYFDLLY